MVIDKSIFNQFSSFKNQITYYLTLFVNLEAFTLGSLHIILIQVASILVRQQ